MNAWPLNYRTILGSMSKKTVNKNCLFVVTIGTETRYELW
jgi:hypothetical protein